MHSLKRRPLSEKNPYEAGKNLLNPKVNVSLSIKKEALNKHKSSSLYDPNYLHQLEPLEGLPDNPVIKSSFSSAKFTFEDFSKILISRRNASAPGLNGIPYKVYKKCPQIASFLFNSIFLPCLKHSVIPFYWRAAKKFISPNAKSQRNLE